MKLSKALTLLTLLFAGLFTSAQTVCTSTGFSNNWPSAFSCVGGGSPITYIVQAGDSVHVSANVGTYDTVYVYGIVTFQNGRSISMTASGVFQIMPGGNVSAGGGGTKISFGGSAVISGAFNQSGAAYANSTGGWYTGYLPVDFLGFNAERVGEALEFEWSTASEHNNDFFSLELSSNGELWEEMAQVRTKAQNGNSQQILQYTSALDNYQVENKRFARIRQVDKDGSFDFSKVIDLPGAVEKPYVLTRNENTRLELQQTHASPMEVTIYNSMGQAVLTESTLDGTLALNVAKSGIYWFQIETEGQRYTEKWLVNP